MRRVRDRNTYIRKPTEVCGGFKHMTLTTRISTVREPGAHYARPIILSVSFHLTFLLHGGAVCLSPLNEFSNE